jgi:hypothetical protein
MPFRSAKQRTYLKIHHPEIYKRWKAEHGTKVVKRKRSKKK